MGTARADIGSRIQRLRIANTLSQAEFAERTDIPTGVVSMLEHGRHSLDDAALKRVANVLGCTPAYLTNPRAEGTASRPWLRAYADAPKRAVDRYVADTEMAIEAFEALRLPFYPESIPTYDDDLNNDEAIEDFADHVRRTAGLDDGDVVGNCIRRAERLGVVVLPMDDELGRHLGLSLRVNATPVIRVSRPGIDRDGTTNPPGDRQRFTVAHEIGHLALHATTPPPATALEGRLIEQQAHRFAGAFLAPAEPLLNDLASLGGRITLNSLAQLKQTWGVAIKMLVVRLRQLEQIDDHQARSLYKQISARKWNKTEPVHVGHESAIWLHKALSKAHVNATSDAPATVGLDRLYFDQWQNWDAHSRAPKELPHGVVPLDRRSAARRRRAGLATSHQ
jgi:Zn-dependent peptidase ImmA (M78 family)/transcriptional regulator with XRE-family HTH domain